MYKLSTVFVENYRQLTTLVPFSSNSIKNYMNPKIKKNLLYIFLFKRSQFSNFSKFFISLPF